MRAAAADGGPEAHLFRYASGTSPPLFAEGNGTPATLEALTRSRCGLFFFDTMDGLPPRDADADGTIDNLTPAIVVTDPSWESDGCLVVRTASFAIDESYRSASETLALPGGPVRTSTAKARAPRAVFLRLDYPRTRSRPARVHAPRPRGGLRRPSRADPTRRWL
jgi:hypothetical protein